MTLDRMRRRASRAEMARVPERPAALSRLRAHLDAARDVGVTVDELDRHHVLLSYDARDHDQWLALDGLYDAAYQQSTIEGDWSFASAPNNWMVIHADIGPCRMKARAEVPDGGVGPPGTPSHGPTTTSDS